MVWVKRTVLLLFVLIVGGMLNYTLPDRDIVWIASAENQVVDTGRGWFYTGGDAATTGGTDADVLFFRGVDANGQTVEYRNQDTGWGWPPYFKFDSNTLHTEVVVSISNAEDPNWMIVRHYGWRSNFFSAFPNALSVTPATGPDQTLIPWFNLLLFAAMAGICVYIYVKIRSFQELVVEPFFAEVEMRISQGSSRMRRWFRGS